MIFAEIEKPIPKFMQNLKPSSSQTVLKNNNKTKELPFPNFKTGWYWHKDKHVDKGKEQRAQK